MKKYQNAIDNFWLAWNCNAIQLDEIMVKDLQTLQELVNKYVLLEKALDKACEELEEFEYGYAMVDHDYGESNLAHKGRLCSTKEQWKEWCLHEDD